MKKTILSAATLGALCSIASAATLATTVNQDTYIRDDGPTGPQNGDGDNENLIGTNAGIADNIRSLFGFDVSTITSTVASTGGGDFDNLTITSATLTIFERRGRTYSDTVNVNAYNSSFLDTVSEWNDPDGDGAAGTGDLTDGGTLGTQLASQVVTWAVGNDNESSVFTLDNAGVKALIEAGDFNLLLNSTTAGPGTDFLSITSDSGTAARHAGLNIEYTVTAIPEPSSAALLGLGGLALILRRRK